MGYVGQTDFEMEKAMDLSGGKLHILTVAITQPFLVENEDERVGRYDNSHSETCYNISSDSPITGDRLET